MAFAAVERLIAFRYLRARRDEGFISVIAGFSLIGITLGVGTLIVVMAVMNGFRVEMLRQMSSISGQLGVQGNRGAIEATPDLLKRLAEVPGVVTAAPSVEGQLMAVAGDRVRGVVLRGMTAQDLRNRLPVAAAIEGPPDVQSRQRGLCRGEDDKPIDWGSLKNFGDDDFTVAIGRRLADLMGVKVGGPAATRVAGVDCHAARRDAALGFGRGGSDLLHGHVRLRCQFRLCTACRGSTIAQSRGGCDRHRDLRG
jgi:lipoprotein-releasing system permease protein